MSKTATVLAGLIVAAFSVCGIAQSDDNPSGAVIRTEGQIEGIHDPSIIRQGTTWYVFSTRTGEASQGELPVHCSTDLHHWTACGSVLNAIPDWIKKQSPATKGLWAPDISYFGGLYHLYYAFSAFGVNTSGIALLTNKTLDPKSSDFHWHDEGLVLLSKKSDDFNAIDPNLILDDNGGAWLSFGSFWSGIKMRRIDAKTGKLSESDNTLYSLATRRKPENAEPAKPNLPPNWQAIEAPFIVSREGYYYLFVSYDLCCKGTKSTYKIAVGRSRKVTGPYLDESNSPMASGGGTVILSGNKRWYGPGGESVMQQKDQDIIVFHAYDGNNGKPSLQISTIAWKDGWPQIALSE